MALLVDEALHYSKLGFSVIPVKPDKKPHIKWESFQDTRATEEKIKEWWTRWPRAMIGIVTGAISGVVVIDVDDPIGGMDAISKYLTKSKVPTVKTPRGGYHLYFKAPERPIPNNAGAIPGCDFRGEGGYVIAPPSQNGTGGAYAWLEGLSIGEVEPADLPSSYISFAFKEYEKKFDGDHARPHETTNNHKMFIEGRRDEDLFHTANLLAKGGGRPEVISQVIERLALSCEPPFPLPEVQEKIKSALKRSEVRERNLAQEIREWVLTTQDHFKTTEGHKELQLTTSREYKTFVMVLLRMCEEGLIQKDGNKRGCYRVVDTGCEEIDWLNAGDATFQIHWPFGIEGYVLTLPKNVIVIAGAPNAGKTAFLLNTVELNMKTQKVYYFTSEMGEIELKKRLSKFDLPLKQWSFVAKERTSNFSDVIRPDDINMIDFLEVYDEFYKIGLYIKEIYDKLQKGIAIIAIQKNLNTDYGLGGMRGLEKARLYLAMEAGKIKIVKAKNWATERNPNGMQLEFKLRDGCKFIKTADWQKTS
jgi:hypothetical protein